MRSWQGAAVLLVLGHSMVRRNEPEAARSLLQRQGLETAPLRWPDD